MYVHACVCVILIEGAINTPHPSPLPACRYFLGAQLRIVQATQLFWTVEEVVAVLRNAYCGSSTVECSHLSSKAQKQWVQEAMERPLLRPLFTEEQQRGLLRRVMYAGEASREQQCIVGSLTRPATAVQAP